MAHPATEAVGSDAGSDYTVFGQFLDAPKATESDLQETPEGETQDSGQPDDAGIPAEASEETEQAEPAEADPQPEAIDPPHSWSKADKEYFQSLPPETQRVVAERERQRDSFLTQRAEALAAERKAIEAKTAEAEQARRDYLEKLQAFTPKLPDPPAPNLIDEDPIEYMRQRDAYERAQMQAQQVQQERERLARENQEREQTTYQQFVQEQVQALTEKVPEFRDPEKRTQFQKDVAEYAFATGYTPEQLKWASAQDIILLNKARLYDATLSASKAVPEKLKVIPKTAKPGQSMSKGEAEAMKRQEKLGKLAKTGSLTDAAAVFKDIL